ncbi:MAG: CsbD family protein [Actinomycetota bacterium]|nr:CsbD family protein [Actinomycetota bacterium]
MSLQDKVTGKLKQATGDITDDAALKREGSKEQEKGEAKDKLARSEQQADAKADEVANLERNT